MGRKESNQNKPEGRIHLGIKGLNWFHFRDNEDIISVNCLKIMYDDELQLSLYRHWSLFESLCHSINLACRFKVWTLKGQKRLHEFLAEMG